MEARSAAARLRETWLKERRDGWRDYGEVPGGKVACSEVYSAAFCGPRFPMVLLYLDGLFILSCPPADEGRDYAGRSPLHSALDLAHGFLSLVFSHSTISGIKGGLCTCTELVSSAPTKTL